MIKHSITKYDIAIAKELGFKSPYPFTQSDTYISIVKKAIQKDGYKYLVNYDPSQPKPFLCVVETVKSTDPNTHSWSSGGSSTENEAVCRAFLWSRGTNPNKLPEPSNDSQ